MNFADESNRRDKLNVKRRERGEVFEEGAEKGEEEWGNDRANILVKLVECTVNGSLSARTR